MFSLKAIYANFLWVLTRIFGIDSAKKMDTYLRFRKKLDLRNPRTLADKVSYIELHHQSPLAPMCTDKIEVRKYVASKGLSGNLIPVVGGPWESVDEVDFEALPDCFVLKATHGCKMNYIVPDKRNLDEMKCRTEMQRWLNTTYGTYSVEPHYQGIPHRIYAEHFLGKQDDLIDYKFHCLNGEPHFIMASSDRKSHGDKRMQVTQHYFDMQWKPIHGMKQAGLEIPGDGSIAKPETFDEMARIARILSEDFEFVRVDLYETNSRVYFGELTFTPFNSVFPMFSEEFLLDMGSKLHLKS